MSRFTTKEEGNVLDYLVFMLFRILTAVAIVGFFLVMVFAIVFGLKWIMDFFPFPSPVVVSWSETALSLFSVLS